nr:hypothetical protein [Escherichia coli]
IDINIGSDNTEIDKGLLLPIRLELRRGDFYFKRMDNMDLLLDTALIDMNVGSNNKEMDEGLLPPIK